MLPTGRESRCRPGSSKSTGGHPVNETEGKSGPSEGSRAERSLSTLCMHELTDTPLCRGQRGHELTLHPWNTPCTEERGKVQQWLRQWQD